MSRHNGQMPIRVELLDGIDADARACAVFDRVWAGGPEVVPVDLAAAITHMGGYLAVAVVDGNDLGASIGFRGWHNGPILHSHATCAEIPGAGFALKQHQRVWAAEQGIPAITWTFDPLVRRNAYFNLVKLGCEIREYLPNFYGEMTDAINIGDESDRLLAWWPTSTENLTTTSTTPSDSAPTSDSEIDFHVALTDNGAPEVRGLRAGTRNLVYLPPDIEGMRASGSPLVSKWRETIRETLTTAFADGWTITGMYERDAYVLEHHED